MTAACGPKDESLLTSGTHNMKQLYLYLWDYDQAYGKFPETLNDLVTKKIISQDDLDVYQFMLSSDPNSKLVYIPGYGTDAVNIYTIIMYTPYELLGKRACLQIDGAVKQLEEQEFLARIAKQKASYKNK